MPLRGQRESRLGEAAVRGRRIGDGGDIILDELLQLCVLRLGFSQDGDVGVGVFPEGEDSRPHFLQKNHN
jgi:hypothetical protein